MKPGLQNFIACASESELDASFSRPDGCERVEQYDDQSCGDNRSDDDFPESGRDERCVRAVVPLFGGV